MPENITPNPLLDSIQSSLAPNEPTLEYTPNPLAESLGFNTPSLASKREQLLKSKAAKLNALAGRPESDAIDGFQAFLGRSVANAAGATFSGIENVGEYLAENARGIQVEQLDAIENKGKVVGRDVIGNLIYSPWESEEEKQQAILDVTTPSKLTNAAGNIASGIGGLFQEGGIGNAVDGLLDTAGSVVSGAYDSIGVGNPMPRLLGRAIPAAYDAFNELTSPQDPTEQRSAGTRLGDAIAEKGLAGRELADEAFNSADEYFGYVNSNVKQQKAIEESWTPVAEAYKKGDYKGMLNALGETAKLVPDLNMMEILATSIPEMALAYTPVIGGIVKSEELNREYREEHDGDEPSKARASSFVATGVAYNYLNKLGVDNALTGSAKGIVKGAITAVGGGVTLKATKDSMRKIGKTMSNSMKKRAVKEIFKAVGKTGGAVAVEGVTEVAQDALVEVSLNLFDKNPDGTEKQLKDVFSEKEIKELYSSFVIGGALGGAIGGTVAGASLATNVRENIIDPSESEALSAVEEQEQGVASSQAGSKSLSESVKDGKLESKIEELKDKKNRIDDKLIEGIDSIPEDLSNKNEIISNIHERRFKELEKAEKEIKAAEARLAHSTDGDVSKRSKKATIASSNFTKAVNELRSLKESLEGNIKRRGTLEDKSSLTDEETKELSRLKGVIAKTSKVITRVGKIADREKKIFDKEHPTGFITDRQSSREAQQKQYDEAPYSTQPETAPTTRDKISKILRNKDKDSRPIGQNIEQEIQATTRDKSVVKGLLDLVQKASPSRRRYVRDIQKFHEQVKLGNVPEVTEKDIIAVMDDTASPETRKKVLDNLSDYQTDAFEHSANASNNTAFRAAVQEDSDLAKADRRFKTTISDLDNKTNTDRVAEEFDQFVQDNDEAIHSTIKDIVPEEVGPILNSTVDPTTGKEFASVAERTAHIHGTIQAVASAIVARKDNSFTSKDVGRISAHLERGFTISGIAESLPSGVSVNLADNVTDADLTPVELKGGKDKKIAPSEITNDLVRDILNSNIEDIAEYVNNLSGDIKLTRQLGKLDGPDKLKSVRSLLLPFISNSSLNFDTITSNEDPDRGAKIARLITIAGKVLEGAIRSETHQSNQAGIPVETFVARSERVYEQVGLDYVRSFGLKLEGDVDAAQRYYASIGKQAIDSMIQQGVVASHSDVPVSQVIVNDIEGNQVLQDIVEDSTTGKIVAKLDTLSFVEGGKVASNQLGVASEFNTPFTSNPLISLFKIGNSQLPTAEGETFIKSKNELTPEGRKTIQKLNSLRFRIKPTMMPVLEQAATILRDKYDNNIYKALQDDNPLITNLLSLQDETLTVLSSSDVGKNEQRIRNFESLLSNLDLVEELQKDGGALHFNYEGAVNDRIHIVQTLLEFQGDKYMARQLLTGAEDIIIKSDEAKGIFIDQVVEESGLDTLDDLLSIGMEQYKRYASNPSTYLADLHKHDSGFTSELKNSPFKLVALLEAINDINEATTDNGVELTTGDIKTNFMPEMDAASSGVVNTLLNIAGRSQAVRDILLQLGFSKDGTTITRQDAYNLLVKKSLGDGVIDITTMKALSDLRNVLRVAGLSDRDIAKIPVMTYFYGQKDKNSSADMANTLGTRILRLAMSPKESPERQQARDHIKSITGVDMKGNLVFKKILDLGQIKQVGESFLPVAEHVVSKMDDTYPEVAKFRTEMIEIHSLLEQTGQWDNKFPSAIASILNRLDGTHDMSLLKNKEVVSQITDEFGKLFRSVGLSNATSMAVNPQHSLDSALLILALRKVFKDNPDFENGLMTVHDAVYGDPEILLQIREEYNKLVLEAATSYDFMGQALLTLEHAISLMPENDKTRRQLTAKLKRLQASHDKASAAKAEFMQGLKADVFGVHESLDPVEAREARTEKDPDVVKAKAHYKGNPNKTDSKKVAPIIDTVAFIQEIHNNPSKSSLASLVKKVKRGLSEDSKAVIDDLVEMLSINPNNAPIVFKSYDELPKLLELGVISKEVFKAIKDRAGNGTISLSDHGIVILGDNLLKGYDERAIDILTGTHPTLDLDGAVSILAHEVKHVFIDSYIQDNPNATEVRYLRDKILPIINTPIEASDTSKEAGRIRYIQKFEGEPTQQLRELVAIYMTEPEVADKIISIISPKTNKETIRTFRNTVIKLLKRLANAILGEENVNKVLGSKLSQTNFQNTERAVRLLDNNARVYLANKELAKELGVNPSTISGIAEHFADRSDKITQALTAVNDMVATKMKLIGNKIYKYSLPKAKATHVGLKQYRAYNYTSDLITGAYHSNIVAQTKATIGSDGSIDKVALSKLHAASQKTMEDTAKIATEYIKSLDDSIHLAFPAVEDRNQLFSVVSRTGIANFMDYAPEDYNSWLEGKVTLTQLLAKYSKDSGEGFRVVGDKMATNFIKGEATTNVTTADALVVGTNKLKAYIAVRALTMIDKSSGKSSMDLLNELKKKNVRTYNEIVSRLIDNRALSNEINRGEGEGVSQKYHDFDGHYTKDVFKEKHLMRVLSHKEANSPEYTEDKDWFTLVEEDRKNGVLKVVAKESTEGDFLQGISLHNNRFVNGIKISNPEILKTINGFKTPQEKAAYLVRNNIVQSTSSTYGTPTYRVLIREKDKINKLGLERSAAHSLYRTYAHNKELLDTEAIRTGLFQNKNVFRAINTLNDVDKLSVELRRNTVRTSETMNKIPFFLKLGDKIDYADLPANLKKEYQEVENVTSFNGFNTKISHVRKDMAHILQGYKATKILNDKAPIELRKIESAYDSSVVLFKLHVAITDPRKLAIDMAANLALLTTKNVSMLDIPSKTKKILKGYKSISEIRGNIVVATVESTIARNKKSKGLELTPAEQRTITKLDSLNKQLVNDPHYYLLKHGFIQSFSTDLLVKELDSVSGLQKDINGIVDAITRDKNEDLNMLGRGINKFMKAGVSLEDGLRAASQLSKNGGTISEELFNMSERLKTHKDLQDVTGYINEIIAGPDSEFVRQGSNVMQITDVVSRGMLFEHLMALKNDTRSEDEKAIEALETFVDYRINLPKPIKALSDKGVILFPGFWIKLQKIIFNLAADYPVSSLMSYALADYLGSTDATAFHQFVGNKVVNGTLLNPGIISEYSLAPRPTVDSIDDILSLLAG